MAIKRNKKIICYIDEYGTAGAGALYLGAVMVPAAEAGRFDKVLSDLLEPNVSELHASRLNDSYVEGLLKRFWSARPTPHLLMLNRRVTGSSGSGPEIYGNAVVELVKIGVTHYKKEIMPARDLNNIDLILDLNHHNSDPGFDAVIEQERRRGGKFRGVSNVAKIDSTAARLLQLADLVASMRKLVPPFGAMRADAVHDRFGIRIL